MKKKKLISFVSVLIIFSLFNVFCAFADSPSESSQTIEYFEDGSYCIITIEDTEPTVSTMSTSTTYSKSGSKIMTFYSSSSEKVCAIKTTGDFTYNSSVGVTCTAVRYTSYVYKEGWSVENISKSTSQTIFTASATVKGNFVERLLGIQIGTTSFTNTVTCDTNGRIS